ncbi:MAG: leucine-rich repeat protein [Ruminococcus sp.]|nr:leucine-rich repeat protein [Ruminococcus sp.]
MNIKRIVSGIMVLAICCGSLAIPQVSEVSNLVVFADSTYSGSCGEKSTYSFDTTTGTLTISGSGDMESYSSSSDVPWYSFTEDIKVAIVKDGVTSIGSYAFASCTSLSSVTISDSVTSIGNCAFYNCTSLSSIAIPDIVTSIGAGAFQGCTSLNSIEIPSSVTTVFYSAFQECTSLADVYYTGTEKEWNNIYIYSLNEPLTSATIYYNFGYCGENCIYSFDETTGTLTISGTGNMESYSSSSDVPWYSFIEDIKKIIIDDGITSIVSNAFYGCTSLTEVTIPNSVTSIGYDAFYKCTSLEEINIPSSVTSIGSYAFYNCASLKEVTIPNSVTSIGYDAFENCTSLKKVVMSNGLTYVSSYAFYGCTSLIEVTIPNSVTSINSYAFRSCTSLESIIIPDSVTSINSSAFRNCASLTSIIIPDSVTSISDYAFYDCTSLADVYYSGTQEEWDSISIGSDNSNLTDATIHCNSGLYGENCTYSFDTTTGTLTIGGTGAIEDASSSSDVPWYSFKEDIETIIIQDGITSIGQNVFMGCTSLSNITIPNGVTTIDRASFESCESLTSISIPSSITSIGYGAFYNCTSLTDVYYDGTEEEWDSISIGSDNSNLTSATIHYFDPYADYTFDVNHDGTINIVDLIMLKKKLLGLI